MLFVVRLQSPPVPSAHFPVGSWESDVVLYFELLNVRIVFFHFDASFHTFHFYSNITVNL